MALGAGGDARGRQSADAAVMTDRPAAPRGAIGIWFDTGPDAPDDFGAWYSREHVFDRVALPGFTRGSWYRAEVGNADPRPFFTLYEADDPAAFGTGDYARALTAPTPWTQRMAPHFHDLKRRIYRERVRLGGGLGPRLLNVRLTIVKSHLDEIDASVAALFDRLDGELGPRVVQARLLSADDAVDGDRDWLVVVHVHDEVAIAAAARAFAGLAAHPGVRESIAGRYELLLAASPADARPKL
jgi:hypothetical protein